jgi:hypothetical protein
MHVVHGTRILRSFAQRRNQSCHVRKGRRYFGIVDLILTARAKPDDLCAAALLHRVEAILTDHSGIKHVFDPNGHPFQEPWDEC